MKAIADFVIVEDSTIRVQHRELGLLLALCRVFISNQSKDQELDAVLEVTNEQTDWDAVARLCAFHCVAPVVSRILECLPSKVAPSARALLRDLTSKSARRSFALFGELLKLKQQFDKAKIDFVTIKGVTLADSLYGDLVLRDFRDIDVLIKRKDLPAAFNLLCQNSMNPDPLVRESELQSYAAFVGQLSFLRQGEAPLLVDLHWQLHFLATDDSLIDESHICSLMGKQFRTLSPELMFIFLCCHGHIDTWGRLRLILDVALAIKKLSLDWSKVLELAIVHGATYQLAFALLAADQLFAVEGPLKWQEVPKRQSDQTMLEQLKLIIAEYPNINITMKERKLLAVNLAAAEKGMLISRLSRMARMLFVPTVDDWVAFRLPAGLSFLYPVLKPLRLLVSRIVDTKGH